MIKKRENLVLKYVEQRIMDKLIMNMENSLKIQKTRTPIQVLTYNTVPPTFQILILLHENEVIKEKNEQITFQQDILYNLTWSVHLDMIQHYKEQVDQYLQDNSDPWCSYMLQVLLSVDQLDSRILQCMVQYK